MEVIDRWEKGLPQTDVLHIVSLLGQKTTGCSEFSYYPFRSAREQGAKPIFEDWLNGRYERGNRRFVADHQRAQDSGQCTAKEARPVA